MMASLGTCSIQQPGQPRFHALLLCMYTSNYAVSVNVISIYLFVYLILSYVILSYLIYLILSYLILSHLISSYLILSYLILSYLILSYLILSYLILSYLYIFLTFEIINLPLQHSNTIILPILPLDAHLKSWGLPNIYNITLQTITNISAVRITVTRARKTSRWT